MENHLPSRLHAPDTLGLKAPVHSGKQMQVHGHSPAKAQQGVESRRSVGGGTLRHQHHAGYWQIVVIDQTGINSGRYFGYRRACFRLVQLISAQWQPWVEYIECQTRSCQVQSGTGSEQPYPGMNEICGGYINASGCHRETGWVSSMKGRFCVRNNTLNVLWTATVYRDFGYVAAAHNNTQISVHLAPRNLVYIHYSIFYTKMMEATEITMRSWVLISEYLGRIGACTSPRGRMG